MHRFICFSMACTLSVSVLAQVRSTKVHNRDAWQIENPQVRVTVTQGTRQQLSIAADLPESRTRFTRTITLTAGEPICRHSTVRWDGVNT